MKSNMLFFCCPDDGLAKGFAVRMGHIQMGYAIMLSVIESPFSGFCHVDELINQNQFPCLIVGVQRAYGGGGNYGLYIQHFQGVNIGSVIDFMGRNGVMHAMAGQEDDFLISESAGFIACLSIGRIDDF